MGSDVEPVIFAASLAIVLLLLGVGAIGAAIVDKESDMGRSKRNRGKRLNALPKKKDKDDEMLEHKYSAPKVVVDRMAYHKIMHWVDKATGEVSGLGKVTRQEDGSFRVIDVMLLPQVNSGSTTELDGPAVAKAMYELRDTPGTLNYWWHSHVNFAAFWSGTDTDTMKEFADAGGQGGWCVATVFNKKREMKSAFCMSAPFDTPINILVDDVPTEIKEFLPTTMFEAWDKEYEKNCKKVEVIPTVTRYAENANSIWLSSPMMLDVRDGWCNRWCPTERKLRRFAVNEFGQFVSRKTFDLGETIPISFYFDPSIIWVGKKLCTDANPDHPKMLAIAENPAMRDAQTTVLHLPPRLGRIAEEAEEVDIPKLRELIKGKSWAEVVAIETQLTDEEQDALWRLPEMDHLFNQSIEDDWGNHGIGY